MFPPDGRCSNAHLQDVVRQLGDANAGVVRERHGLLVVWVVGEGQREAHAVRAVERTRGALNPGPSHTHAPRARHHRHAGSLVAFRVVERADERADVAGERLPGLVAPGLLDQPGEPSLLDGLEHRAHAAAFVQASLRDEDRDHRRDALLAREVPRGVQDRDERGEGVVEVSELLDGIRRGRRRVSVCLQELDELHGTLSAAPRVDDERRDHVQELPPATRRHVRAERRVEQFG